MYTNPLPLTQGKTHGPSGSAFALCLGSRCCVFVSLRLRSRDEIHPSAEPGERLARRSHLQACVPLASHRA